MLNRVGEGDGTTVLDNSAAVWRNEMSDGNARQWPFGAVQPWNQSLSHWHAWASQMPAALASICARDAFRAARTWIQT